MAEKKKKPEAEVKTANEVENSKKEEEKKEKNPQNEELQKLQQQVGEEKDKYMRLAAEYDNFRKRSQKEKESIYPDAVASTVTSLLVVADNFERALEAECSDAEYKKGMEMTFKSLLEVFENLNVKSFGAAGEKFDPNLHNAVMHDEDDSEKENEISEVFQKGYKLGDRVLRFAMVKVIN